MIKGHVILLFTIIPCVSHSFLQCVDIVNIFTEVELQNGRRTEDQEAESCRCSRISTDHVVHKIERVFETKGTETSGSVYDEDDVDVSLTFCMK